MVLVHQAAILVSILAPNASRAMELNAELCSIDLLVFGAKMAAGGTEARLQ